MTNFRMVRNTNASAHNPAKARPKACASAIVNSGMIDGCGIQIGAVQVPVAASKSASRHAGTSTVDTSGGLGFGFDAVQLGLASELEITKVANAHVFLKIEEIFPDRVRGIFAQVKPDAVAEARVFCNGFLRADDAGAVALAPTFSSTCVLSMVIFMVMQPLEIGWFEVAHERAR